MTTHSSTEEATDQLTDGQELFVYAVVPAERRVTDLVGLDGAPVTTVSHGAIAAVVSAFDVERPPGRRADLIAYNTVIEQIACEGAVAPVRFGTALPDGDAVVDHLLGPQEAVLTDLLGQLIDRHQFNLRAHYVEETVLREIVETDPAIRELRQRTRDLPEVAAYGDRVQLGERVAHAVEVRSEADAAELMAAISALVVASVDRGRSGLESVLDVALLVDDDRGQELEERLEALAETVHERMRLRLVGPIAPFDFVGEL